MAFSLREGLYHMGQKLAVPWRSWQERRRLRQELANFPAPERDRLLADAGMRPADLRTIFQGHRHSRKLMTAMMRRFDIDPAGAAPRYWGSLRDAQRTCSQCKKTRRCRRWLELGRLRDVPRRFCPNAPLFEEIGRTLPE